MNKGLFFIRFQAETVDGLLLLLPITLSLSFLANSQTIPELVANLFSFLIFVFLPISFLGVFYRPFFISRFKATLGKALSGLKVTSMEGEALNFKRSLFRETIGYSFSSVIFGLGFLSIFKDVQGRAWHDKAIGSKVTKVNNLWIVGFVTLLLLIGLHGYLVVQAISTFASGPVLKQIQQIPSLDSNSEPTTPSYQETSPDDQNSQNEDTQQNIQETNNYSTEVLGA